MATIILHHHHLLWHAAEALFHHRKHSRRTTITVRRALPVGHPFYTSPGFSRISNLRALRIGPVVIWVARHYR